MAVMAYMRGWDDLPPDLLTAIADGLPIQAYTRVRAVCTAWRAALRPTSPSLLVRDDRHRFSARWLCPSWSSTVLHQTLATILSPTRRRRRCVGSGHGRIAVDDPKGGVLGLVNPLTGEEIPFHLPFVQLQKTAVSEPKVVFAPNPTPAEFTAAAITGGGRVVTYTTQGNGGWTIAAECPRLAKGDDIADVVYHEKGDGENNKVVYCLTRSGDVHVLRLPTGRLPACFEPLFDKASRRVFYPMVAFAPPHDMIRTSTNSKNLVVFDDGHLYQIWRNDDVHIFVLRYYPRRRPCWLPAKDLGGYSVFVGKNNAVALRVDGGGGGGGGGPGLRGNCVYWIDRCSDEAKVFDMETGKSAPCFPGVDAICWYYLGHMESSSRNTSVATSAYQLQKRARHAWIGLSSPGPFLQQLLVRFILAIS